MQLLWQLQVQSSKLKVKNKNIKFKVYLKNKPLADLPKEIPGWQYKVLKPKYWWTQWRLPLDLYLTSERPDLFFTPGHYAPRFCPCPYVISIMDLAFLRFPEQFEKKDLYQLVNWTKYSVAKAAHILTISEFSKREIIHFYHYPEDQITVTYPGISQVSNPCLAGRQAKSQNHNLKLKTFRAKYFLYLGTLQPRKNLVRLIEAFNSAVKQLNNEAIKLVIVGKKGWLYEEIFKRVQELNLESKVIFTGFVSEEEKIALLNNAAAFVLPSLYEGFGIPVLEAMAAGCPVLISKNSSLPEVGGKAAVYIENPCQTDSIQKGLTEMLKLNGREREAVISEGYKQAEKFSWEACARKTMEVICSLSEINKEKN